MGNMNCELRKNEQLTSRTQTTNTGHVTQNGTCNKQKWTSKSQRVATLIWSQNLHSPIFTLEIENNFHQICFGALMLAFQEDCNKQQPHPTWTSFTSVTRHFSEPPIELVISESHSAYGKNSDHTQCVKKLGVSATHRGAPLWCTVRMSRGTRNTYSAIKS